MSESSESDLEIFFMLFLAMLIFYTVIGLYMEHHKPPVGHETGVIVLVGMAISFGVKQFGSSEAINLLEFPSLIFFQVCLPLIIFASGYNMKRRKFFSNLKNITKFGLVATILTFIIYSSLTVLLFKFVTLEKYLPDTDETEVWTMTPIEIMLVCSILCSSDIIAAVTIIKYEDQPKLFSIILGEGLSNDAVAIVLY